MEVFNDAYITVKAEFATLRDIRASVSRLNIKASDAIGYYTGVNTKLLATAGQLSTQSSNGEIASLAAAYTNFLQGKERAGIERAVLASAFGAGRFAAGKYEQFLSLVTQQDTFMGVCEAFA